MILHVVIILIKVAWWKEAKILDTFPKWNITKIHKWFNIEGRGLFHAIKNSFYFFIENFKKSFQCRYSKPVKICFNLYFFHYFFQNGDSPLHIAAAMGRRKLVRILLESPLIDMELKNQQNEGKENTFSNFSCMFLNPNNFFQFEF